jgi:hypothetical protein
MVKNQTTDLTTFLPLIVISDTFLSHVSIPEGVEKGIIDGTLHLLSIAKPSLALHM